MSNFDRVLVATDFSAASSKLTTCLFELCPSTETEVVVTHVFEDDDDADPHRQTFLKIENQLKSLTEEIKKCGYEKVIVVSGIGQASKQINKIAIEQEVDLILIASHGKGFIRTALLGSTSFDLARMTEIPLFINKMNEDESSSINLLDHVLVPTDFSTESLSALNVLRNLKDYINKVTLVNVIERSRNEEELAERKTHALAKLNNLSDELRAFGIEAQVKVAKGGSASKKLQKIAYKLNASLIIMSKTGDGIVDGLKMGSTAQNLSLNSNCPLMLLPEKFDNMEMY
jgi:nucleotide-binding universal stress UspA family protein